MTRLYHIDIKININILNDKLWHLFVSELELINGADIPVLVGVKHFEDKF